MSKVVTVKAGESRAVILQNDWQSPSPEGTNMMLEPSRTRSVRRASSSHQLLGLGILLEAF